MITKNVFLAISLILLGIPARSQSTFKAGWNTYQTGTLTREYTYSYGIDTSRLSLTDSALVFVTPDSLVTLTIRYRIGDRSVYKTIYYFSSNKQLLKKEEYKDDNLLQSFEWRYDDKNRKSYYVEDNKGTGNSFRKTYEYATDKKTGDNIITESSYCNGRIEFYTKSFYDKKNVKYKEVRLNDNNKDVVHIESYVYGENGKVKERSVYFPEWKVTRNFQEREGNMLSKCARCLPVGTAEKIALSTRVLFMKRLLGRNWALLNDPECDDFEYTFKNFTNCEIVVTNTKVNNTKKVVFRYKDKV